MKTLTTSAAHLFDDLPGALPIDVEHHVFAARKRLFDGFAGRAVVIAVHLAPIRGDRRDRASPRNPARVDEVVMHPVDLGRGACGGSLRKSTAGCHGPR